MAMMLSAIRIKYGTGGVRFSVGLPLRLAGPLSTMCELETAGVVRYGVSYKR